PRAFPWEQDLPWALARLREIITAGPERGDRAPENACVKGAVVGTKHGTGTSATAKIRRVSGTFVAGRRRGARSNGARMTMSKPGTQKQRRIAGAEPSLYPRPLKTPNLPPRVVTQPNLFFASDLRSAGVPQSSQEFGLQPSTLLLRRLSSS